MSTPLGCLHVGSTGPAVRPQHVGSSCGRTGAALAIRGRTARRYRPGLRPRRPGHHGRARRPAAQRHRTARAARRSTVDGHGVHPEAGRLRAAGRLAGRPLGPQAGVRARYRVVRRRVRPLWTVGGHLVAGRRTGAAGTGGGPARTLVAGPAERDAAARRPGPGDRGLGGSTGMAAALGPPLGGWLIDALSWRWVFFLNLPL